jgi:hypothetical protein
MIFTGTLVFLLSWNCSQIICNRLRQKPWYTDVWMPTAAVLSFALLLSLVS